MQKPDIRLFITKMSDAFIIAFQIFRKQKILKIRIDVMQHPAKIRRNQPVKRAGKLPLSTPLSALSYAPAPSSQF